MECFPFAMESKFIKIAEGTQGLFEEVFGIVFFIFHVKEILTKFFLIDEIRGFGVYIVK